MHVVFDARIHMDYMSGISRYIMLLLKHLFEIDATNQYSILLNNSLEKDNPIFEFEKLPNVTCITTNFAHMGPKAMLQLPKFIKSLNADVYHYPHIDIPFVGMPCVSTVHDSSIRGNVKRHSDFLGIKTLYLKWALKRTITKSTKVLFISHATKKEILNSYKLNEFDKKYIVNPNGFDPNFTLISSDSISATKLKFNLSKPFFFFAGALREHKNVKRIIEGFKNANLKDFELIMVGSKYEQYQVDLNHPNIRHLGMVSDEELKALYHLSYAFLFPSIFEGFGLPILEAMSFGSPVITTNYGATKEVAGNAALLVDPINVLEITQGIQKLATNQQYYLSLKELGLKRVNTYSWKENAKKVLETYNSLHIKQ